MERLIVLASSIWIILAIIIGFMCLIAAIGAAAVMITAFIDKVVGWFRGDTDV